MQRRLGEPGNFQVEVGRRITDCKPIYVPWRRDLKRMLSGSKVIGKGKAHVGKMDAILTDSHLDTRIKIRLLINVIVPKLEYAEVWEVNAKLAKQLETVQVTAPQKVLGCSRTTSDTVLRAEMAMLPRREKVEMAV